MTLTKMTMVAAIAAMATLLSAAPALARPLPPGGLTRQEVVTWLEDKGYEADLHAGEGGEMIVSSTVSGVNYDISFYDCVKGRCGAISFQAGWSESRSGAAETNLWNEKKRYVFSYYRASNDSIWVEYDVDIAPMGSWEMLDAAFDRWQDQVGKFKTFVDNGGAFD